MSREGRREGGRVGGREGGRERERRKEGERDGGRERVKEGRRDGIKRVSKCMINQGKGKEGKRGNGDDRGWIKSASELALS